MELKRRNDEDLTNQWHNCKYSHLLPWSIYRTYVTSMVDFCYCTRVGEGVKDLAGQTAAARWGSARTRQRGPTRGMGWARLAVPRRRHRERSCTDVGGGPARLRAGARARDGWQRGRCGAVRPKALHARRRGAGRRGGRRRRKTWPTMVLLAGKLHRKQRNTGETVKR